MNVNIKQNFPGEIVPGEGPGPEIRRIIIV